MKNWTRGKKKTAEQGKKEAQHIPCGKIMFGHFINSGTLCLLVHVKRDQDL